VPDSKAITLHAASTENATGADGAFDVQGRLALKDIILDVPAVLGTSPTLDVVVQTTLSVSGSWRTVKAFQRFVAPGVQKIPIVACDRFVRVVRTIGGTTPSFTFGVTAKAVQMYVMPSDVLGLGNALPPSMVGKFSQDDLLGACFTVSLLAEGFLDAAYEMPIVDIGSSLPAQLARMVAFSILEMRGMLGGGIDPMILDSKDDVLSWLNKIARGTIRPPDIIDTTPEVEEEGAYGVSNVPRGW
jgi:hypothetical protein